MHHSLLLSRLYIPREPNRKSDQLEPVSKRQFEKEVLACYYHPVYLSYLSTANPGPARIFFSEQKNTPFQDYTEFASTINWPSLCFRHILGLLI